MRRNIIITTALAMALTLPVAAFAASGGASGGASGALASKSRRRPREHLERLGIVQMMRFALQDDIDAGKLTPVLPEVPLPLVPDLHAFGRRAPARARLFIDFLATQLTSFA